MREYIVNKNERITIPYHLRKKFGIIKGTKIYLVEENDGIKAIPITARRIEKKVGFIGTKGKLLRNLLKEKAREKLR